MNVPNQKQSIALLLTILTLLASPQALADSKGKSNKGKPTTEATMKSNETVSTVSKWISPNLGRQEVGQSPTQNPTPSNSQMIRLEPGRTIPLKFRLFSNNVEKKSTANVSVNATPSLCIGVSPTPVPTNLENKQPGNSEKSRANVKGLKFGQNGFTLLWKSSKDASGCFVFTVTYGASETLTSPTFYYVKSEQR